MSCAQHRVGCGHHTHALHARSGFSNASFLAACARHLAQHSAALAVLCERPHVSTLPSSPSAAFGSYPQRSSICASEAASSASGAASR
eukprot:scaffold271205_cov36-Tisochrysis_lutea.AAC.2